MFIASGLTIRSFASGLTIRSFASGLIIRSTAIGLTIMFIIARNLNIFNLSWNFLLIDQNLYDEKFNLYNLLGADVEFESI